MNLIDSDLAQIHQQLNRSTQDLKAELVCQVEQWQTEVETVHQQFKHAELVKFAQLLFAAARLAIGTVLSSVSPELVTVAAGQWRAVQSLI